MSSSDSKGRTTLRRPGYEQFALGFVGLCVVGMCLAAALSPAERAMYSLSLSSAALGAESVKPTQEEAVSEAPSKTVEVAVVVPPTPEHKPAYVPFSTPFTPVSGDSAWLPQRQPLSVVSPPSGGSITNLRGGVTVKSVAKLGSFFNSLNYSLTKVRYGHQPVPRVFLDCLPRDLKTMMSVSARKSMFLKAMLPLILQVNDTISADRGKLLEINSQVRMGGTLSERDRSWIKDLARRHGLDKTRLNRTVLVKLLERVDVVPPSLALAQAVEESGWGTSRFAQEGNAPFGQRTFNETRGLVPLDRDADGTHAVRTYNRLIDGVHAYIDNLNTHRAYREFRKARATMRLVGTGLDSFGLAKTLMRYSERGQDYVDTLHTIMSANDLAPLDRARLHGAQIAGLTLSGG